MRRLTIPVPLRAPLLGLAAALALCAALPRERDARAMPGRGGSVGEASDALIERFHRGYNARDFGALADALTRDEVTPGAVDRIPSAATYGELGRELASAADVVEFLPLADGTVRVREVRTTWFERAQALEVFVLAERADEVSLVDYGLLRVTE